MKSGWTDERMDGCMDKQRMDGQIVGQMCGMRLDGICSLDISDSWWRRDSAFTGWNLQARKLSAQVTLKSSNVWTPLKCQVNFKRKQGGRFNAKWFNFNLITTYLLLHCNARLSATVAASISASISCSLYIFCTLFFPQLVKADKQPLDSGSALGFIYIRGTGLFFL